MNEKSSARSYSNCTDPRLRFETLSQYYKLLDSSQSSLPTNLCDRSLQMRKLLSKPWKQPKRVISDDVFHGFVIE